jgi:hypothetical protein
MKIQKIVSCASAAILAAALAACSPIEFEEYPDESGGTPGGAVAGATERLTADSADALPVETQLILGTLLLEGTDQAVDSEQAAVLLPLWQHWHNLNRTNAAAQADKDALLGQIQSAMTEEQIRAIAAMNLTQQDVLDYVEENGVGFPSRTTGTPPAGAEGTPPPGNTFPFGGDQTQTLSPDELATLQSVYQGGYGGSRGPEWMLLHALLDLLESKVQA